MLMILIKKRYIDDIDFLIMIYGFKYKIVCEIVFGSI